MSNIFSRNKPFLLNRANFFRLTHTVAGYVPITNTITFAAELRMGLDVVPWCASRPNIGTPATWTCTYPDRLFFMGGFDSMRGWLQDTFVPQDYADVIKADFSKPSSDPLKFTIAQVPLRGGNLMINPRLELRIPIVSPLETVLFFDSGNLWADASYPFTNGFHFALRTSVGTGLRLQTPIGPVVFDYGINLSRLIDGPSDPRYTYEDFGAFHFAIGLF